MQPTGIEPVSTALQTAAMTTSARVALIWGETGNRTLANYFTGSCAATTLETPHWQELMSLVSKSLRGFGLA